MSFYHPLTLGTRRVRRAEPTTPPSADLPRAYDEWREGTQRRDHEYEEHPEERVVEALRQSSGRDRPWLILGEPGAGKSTLLEAWFRRWAAQLEAPHLGMRIPVLFPLKELTAEDAKLGKDALADHLWRLGLDHGALLDGDERPVYRADQVRAFSPVWLLDGLDELHVELMNDQFVRRLVNLPGAKVITCRTAVFESHRRGLGRWLSNGQENEVLGLKPEEQIEFLTGVLDGNAERATRVHRAVRQNMAVLLVARNPLMLNLIAEVAEPDQLPSTRAGFYRDAVREMWHRRLDIDVAHRFARERDEVLTTLAGRLRMEDVEGPLQWVIEAAEADGVDRFRTSGLLRFSERRERFSFVHLTFQEYFLARALAYDGLQTALEAHWADVRYEETLALLIAHLVDQQRDGEVERAIRWLVEWGEQAHRSDLSALYTIRRSPLRVALHLLARSGIAARSSSIRSLQNWLRERVYASRSRRLATAGDRSMPGDLLAHLANDSSRLVRQWTAANPNTPADALARLTEHPDYHVRRWTAANPSTPADALARLAEDPNGFVRRGTAANPSTPADALALLAQDPNYSVRGAAAANPSMPPDALARLTMARDSARWAAAENPSISCEALTRLAEHPNVFVRGRAAVNPRTPADALSRLAEDPDERVRQWTADNPNTPADSLARMAEDPDDLVRRLTAENAGMPVDALARLAEHSDDLVRRAVAWNPSTPADTLARLAEDPDDLVRQWTAANPSTPTESLARLAEHSNNDVRAWAAMNLMTPADALARLAEDPNDDVRKWAAENPSTPTDALARLAEDPNDEVRSSVADNPSAPADALARLAKSPSYEVRSMVARHPGTPPDALARLAEDQGDDIREFALRNPNTLLESL